MCIQTLQNNPEGPLVNPEFFAEQEQQQEQGVFCEYELYLKVEEPGCYMGHVKYNDQIIGPQWFEIISLTGKKIPSTLSH